MFTHHRGWLFRNLDGDAGSGVLLAAWLGAWGTSEDILPASCVKSGCDGGQGCVLERLLAPFTRVRFVSVGRDLVLQNEMKNERCANLVVGLLVSSYLCLLTRSQTALCF